ncbi:MAG: hypothetical protein ACLFTI_07260, partial [Anaerolineales bacterium]
DFNPRLGMGRGGMLAGDQPSLSPRPKSPVIHSALSTTKHPAAFPSDGKAAGWGGGWFRHNIAPDEASVLLL